MRVAGSGGVVEPLDALQWVAAIDAAAAAAAAAAAPSICFTAHQAHCSSSSHAWPSGGQVSQRPAVLLLLNRRLTMSLSCAPAAQSPSAALTAALLTPGAACAAATRRRLAWVCLSPRWSLTGRAGLCAARLAWAAPPAASRPTLARSTTTTGSPTSGLRTARTAHRCEKGVGADG